MNFDRMGFLCKCVACNCHYRCLQSSSGYMINTALDINKFLWDYLILHLPTPLHTHTHTHTLTHVQPPPPPLTFSPHVSSLQDKYFIYLYSEVWYQLKTVEALVFGPLGFLPVVPTCFVCVSRCLYKS